METWPYLLANTTYGHGSKAISSCQFNFGVLVFVLKTRNRLVLVVSIERGASYNEMVKPKSPNKKEQ
jgi:hypothetical protein